jgi:hypothetical protein
VDRSGERAAAITYADFGNEVLGGRRALAEVPSSVRSRSGRARFHTDDQLSDISSFARL